MFPVLHGPYGEDGTIQGMFEMADKPYVGCDHRSSAIAMDKVFTKLICMSQGVETSRFIAFTRGEWNQRSPKIINDILQLNFPVFVKAAHLGSAIGVIKVNYVDDLIDAINEAFEVDQKILVEEEVRGRELEFAVIGNDSPKTFPPGEVLTHGKVYTYEAKYGLKGFKTSSKADISVELIEQGRELALTCYRALGCEGMARIDFFLDEDGKYWLNEINPIPGFTEISLYPKI